MNLSRGKQHTTIAASLLFLSVVGAWAMPRVVGNFEAGDLSGWKQKSFKGSTRYAIVEIDGRKVLRADSSASASGMFKKIKIDLDKTPYLNWSWKVKNILTNVEETSKSGDDYPARIYVVFSGGLLFWKTRALNYVWSSNQPLGASWSNAYTSNATMVTVHSGNRDVGKWITQKRNVREDVLRYLGKDISIVDAVALMTDTDNSGQKATAYYGDIYFTEE